MRRGARRWAGLALLCAIAASAWIADTAWPSDVPVLLRYGVESLLLFLLFLPFSWAEFCKTRWRQWAELSAWGAALVALPTLIAVGAAPQISAVAAALIFCAVPAVVVLVAAQRDAGFGVNAGPLPKLGVAVAGVAGAALVLPFTAPDSPAGYGWLGAMVVAAVLSGIALVQLHRRLAVVSVATGVAAICAGSGLLELLFAATQTRSFPRLNGAAWGHGLVLFALVDAPLWVLTVWLVRDLAPRKFASRYLLAPMLTVVEGVVLVRPAVNWTLLAGVGLMGFASWRLLASDDSADAPSV